MRASSLNLMLLDDNTLIAIPLSNYLNKRFGARVNISTFFDIDKCLRAIDEKSHVIILDYLQNNKSHSYKNGLKNFNSIKNLKPKTEVTMITSDGNMTQATEEMQRGACEYVMQSEQYVYNIPKLVNKIVIAPIKKVVTLPIKQVTHYYNVKDYIMMFVVAFISIGVLVLVGYLSAAFFR